MLVGSRIAGSGCGLGGHSRLTERPLHRAVRGAYDREARAKSAAALEATVVAAAAAAAAAAAVQLRVQRHCVLPPDPSAPWWWRLRPVSQHCRSVTLQP